MSGPVAHGSDDTLPASDDPHGAGEVLTLGSALAEARGVVILLHGRGASAQDILALAPAIGYASLAFLAPQAANATWYPNSFLAERASNQPWLDSALRKVGSVVEQAVAAGVPRGRIVIAGFSQGACLSSEFVARHPARYAGVIAFTGGLIGPLGADLRADLPAAGLDGTPTLLLSGDPDPHVPWQRVEETAEVLTAMGAQVTTRRYPGRPHTVSPEEVTLARTLIASAFAG